MQDCLSDNDNISERNNRSANILPERILQSGPVSALRGDGERGEGVCSRDLGRDNQSTSPHQGEKGIQAHIHNEEIIYRNGIIGVPVSFLNGFYTPEQFSIIGLSQKAGYGLMSYKFYDDWKELKPDGTPTGSSGKKTNGNPVMAGKPKKGNYYSNGIEDVHSLYGRIFIKVNQ